VQDRRKLRDECFRVTSHSELPRKTLSYNIKKNKNDREATATAKPWLIFSSPSSQVPVWLQISIGGHLAEIIGKHWAHFDDDDEPDVRN
jgi:hypothetical protein